VHTGAAVSDAKFCILLVSKGGKEERVGKQRNKIVSNMTGVLRRESIGIAINNEVLLRAAGLAIIGRVLGRPGLSVHGAIGTVGDPVNQHVICVKVVL
jgi:hypothetical protein